MRRGSGLLLATLFAAAPAVAQTTSWTRVGGPFGASVERVDAWPERGAITLTAGRGQTYISEDAGESWSYLGQGRYPAFAGRDTVVFASPVRYSVDGGRAWRESPLPDSASGQSAAVNPHTGTIVVVSRRTLARYTIGEARGEVFAEARMGSVMWTGSAFLATVRNGVDGPFLVSTDDGRTWSRGNPLPDGGLLGPLVRMADHLLAVSGDAATLLRSEDGGHTWTREGRLSCRAQLVAANDDSLVLASGADVWAVARATGTCRKVLSRNEVEYLAGWRSSGGLASTASLPGGLLLVSERHNLNLSRDSGETWEVAELRGIPRARVTALHAEPRDGSLWAGTGTDGVFRSIDGGINWTYRGFRGEPNVSAIVTGHSPDEVWVATQVSGLHRSLDGGDTWTLVPNHGLGSSVPHAAFGSLAWSKETESVIATWPVWDVFASSDGQGWIPFAAPARSRVDPPIWGSHLSSTGWLYVGMLYPLSHEWELLRKRVTTPLEDWEAVGGRLPAPAEQILEAEDGSIYAGISFPFDATLGPAGVYRLVPPDTSWHLVHGDVNPESFLQTPDGSVWVVHRDGLLRSSDGLTFVDASEGLPDCLETVAYDSFWREVLVGTCYDGLYSLALPTSIATEEESELAAALSVYPNPAVSEVQVEFQHPGGSFTIGLFDALGRLVTRIDERAEAGVVQRRLPVHGLPSGLHFVRIESGGASQTRPVVLLRRP